MAETDNILTKLHELLLYVIPAGGARASRPPERVKPSALA